ncbi:MAG: Fe-S oxidoreductase, partial [Flavobacteriaceae bacterium]
MNYIPNIIFALILVFGIGFFANNVRKLIRNIKLGKSIDRNDQKSVRFANMARIALGQSKMVRRPVSGILHIVVYVGFILINIELLEIVLDGLLGTHRLFLPFIGEGVYGFLIGTFEILAFLVLVAVIVFWARRNILKIARFMNPEMKGWPKKDADFILYFEMVLMSLFLIMNATDLPFQEAGVGNPISQFIAPWFSSMSESSVHLIEQGAWWAHIVGILVFLNYLYYSKHLHILLAFPNTYFGDLKPQGAFDNLESVKKEVALMMDPDADPFAMP